MFTKKMLKALLVAPVIGAFAVASGYAQFTSTAAVTVTVQPEVEVSISVTPDEYDFGVMTLNTSTAPQVAHSIENTGNVGVTLESHIESVSSAGQEWSSDTTEVDLDQFMLAHVVRNTHMTATVHNENPQYRLTTSEAILMDADDSDNQTSLAVGASRDSWFCLSLPNSVTDASEQTIEVRITATNQ